MGARKLIVFIAVVMFPMGLLSLNLAGHSLAAGVGELKGTKGEGEDPHPP